jgi:hypothetical protein
MIDLLKGFGEIKMAYKPKNEKITTGPNIRAESYFLLFMGRGH